MNRAPIWALLPVALLVACNAISGVGDYTKTNGALEAGGPDGNTLLVNPGFEEPACQSWFAESSTITEVDGGAHGGGRACKVCGLPGNSVWGISQTRDAIDLVVGQQLVAEVWVRAPDGGGDVAAQNLSLVSIDDDPTGSGGGANEVGGPANPDEHWVHVVAAIHYDGSPRVELEVLSRWSGGGCFLVDDAALYTTP